MTKFNLLSMINKENPIGLFDSGIGGLSVLKQFIKFLPNENYIYLGDTARVPYGNKSVATVKRYAAECTEFLLSKNVKLIVIACNTVSSVAIDDVIAISDVPVIGMITPAATAAIRATRNGKIGVIGTRATIESDAYSKAIYSFYDNDLDDDSLISSSESKEFNIKNITVYNKACPLFVPLVEEGLINHRATKLIAQDYLENLKTEGIDTLVLGCTHYPLLAQLFTDLMPNVNLIDSGEHSAVAAIRLLGEKNLLNADSDSLIKKPSVKFFVTDIPSTFNEIANMFLNFDISKPEIVSFGN